DDDVLVGRAGLNQAQRLAVELQVAGKLVVNHDARPVGGDGGIAALGQDPEAARTDETAFGESIAQAVDPPGTQVKGKVARSVELLVIELVVIVKLAAASARVETSDERRSANHCFTAVGAASAWPSQN